MHLPKLCGRISFDYAVVETEKRIQVMRYYGKWEDLGTWNTFTNAISEEITGNAVAPLCTNTHIINELQIPIIALGISNAAIVATPDGILVTDKVASDKLKEYVLEKRLMCEKSGWGEYQVLDYRIDEVGTNYLTKRLVIYAGHHISYHRHVYRTEMWMIVSGSGFIVVDGKTVKIERGDMASIQPGKKHGIKAETDLHIIEIQMGNEITEEDVERLEWNWN